jgi:hypothetical protein
MAGQLCLLCDLVIAPGDEVSFQKGKLVHLTCYSTSPASRKTISDGDRAAHSDKDATSEQQSPRKPQHKPG